MNLFPFVALQMLPHVTIIKTLTVSQKKLPVIELNAAAQLARDDSNRMEELANAGINDLTNHFRRQLLMTSAS